MLFHKIGVFSKLRCVKVSHLVLVAALFLVTKPIPVFADNLSSVMELAESGDVDGAIAKLDEILSQDEGNVQIRFFKSTLLLESGRVAEAKKVLEEVAKRFPDLPEAYNNLAALYARQGKLLQAKTILENLIISHPNFAIAHKNLSDIYTVLANRELEKAARLGKRSDATIRKLELFEELIEFVPLEAVAKQKVETKKKPSTLAPLKKPEKTRAAPSETAAKQKLLDVVKSWLEAWVAKDIDRYREFYTVNFEYKGIEKADWMETKRERFKRSGAIDVKITDINVSIGGNTAAVIFTQKYRSGIISDVGTKRLTLIKTGDGWKISSETWTVQ